MTVEAVQREGREEMKLRFPLWPASSSSSEEVCGEVSVDLVVQLLLNAGAAEASAVR
jgi:hypothetical protein